MRRLLYSVWEITTKYNRARLNDFNVYAYEVPVLCPWPRSRAALELAGSIAPELRRYISKFPCYPEPGWKDAVITTMVVTIAIAHTLITVYEIYLRYA